MRHRDSLDEAQVVAGGPRKPVRRGNPSPSPRSSPGGYDYSKKKPVASYGVIADLMADGSVNVRYIRRQWAPWKVVDVLLTHVDSKEAADETVNSMLSLGMVLGHRLFPGGRIKP